MDGKFEELWKKEQRKLKTNLLIIEFKTLINFRMKAIRQLHSAIFEQIILPSRLTNADGIFQNKKISQY